MSGVVLKQFGVSTSYLYVTKNPDDTQDLPVEFVFVLNSQFNSDPNNLPPTLKLSETWDPKSTKSRGAYCFLPKPPTDTLTFFQKIVRLLGGATLNNFRFLLWIADPDNIVNPTALPQFQVNNTNIIFQKTTNFCFRNSTLHVNLPAASDQGATIDLNDATNPTGFRITNPQDESLLKLVSTVGSLSVDVVNDGIELLVPIEAQGLLRFDVNLCEEYLAALDVGLRFFWNDASGDATSARYPVFHLPTDGSGPATVPLTGNLDPWYAESEVSAQRTNYGFRGATLGKAPVLLTYYRTTYGQPVCLTPKFSASTPGAGPAKLVFAAQPAAVSTGAACEDAVYLMPQGQFVYTSGPHATTHYMCGLSGTEFLLMANDNTVEFIPGKPAFAPGFVPPTGDRQQVPHATQACAGADVPPSETLLVDSFGGKSFTTSWLRVLQPSDSQADGGTALEFGYCVQPLNSVYYGFAKDSLPQAVGCLISPLQTPSPGPVYPMAPYAGVYVTFSSVPEPTIASKTFQAFEASIIAADRRKQVDVNEQLGPIFFQLNNDTPFEGGFATTPQGLLISLNDSNAGTGLAGTWQQLLLAKSPVPENADQFLSFNASSQNPPPGNPAVVSPQLSNTLMNDQLFLVVTVPAPLGSFSNELKMDEYTFQVAVGQPSTDKSAPVNAMMIFKYTSALTVQELINDPTYWASKSTFVGDAYVQNAIDAMNYWIKQAQDQVKLAQKLGQDSSIFKDFLYRVTSPDWTGILIMNCPLNYQKFPLDLLILLGGIDEQLRAFDFGITSNQIEGVETPVWDMEKSSLFALVHYLRSLENRNAHNQLTFNVNRLDVQFVNSALTFFKSQIAVTLPQWFDEDVDLQGVNPQTQKNTLSIDGTYQKNDDGIGTVSFDDNSTRTWKFPGTGYRVLENVFSNTAQLVPVSEEKPSEDVTIAKSSFRLDGNLDFNFNTVGGNPIDLFSYGDSANQSGLSFNGYDLNMTTKVQGNSAEILPNSQDPNSMIFTPVELQVDDSGVSPRGNSFVGTLPMKLSGFQYNPNGISPGGIGGDFALNASQTDPPVQGQDVGLTAANPKFAIQYELATGSLGALVTSNETLVSTLILGWTTPATGMDDDRPSLIFVPPEQFHNNSFSMEGVLRTGFDKVVLARMETDSPCPEGAVYVLTLTDMDFTLFSISLVYSFLTDQSKRVIRDLSFFGNPKKPAGSNLAWYLTNEQTTTTGFGAGLIINSAMEVLAGVRVNIDPLQTNVVGPTISKIQELKITTEGAIDQICEGGGDSPIVYNPDGGIVFYLSLLWNGLSFQALFSDPNFYGAVLEIGPSKKPGGKPNGNGGGGGNGGESVSGEALPATALAMPIPDWARHLALAAEDGNGDKSGNILDVLGGLKFEITYRRLSDTVGAWSADIKLPIPKIKMFTIAELELPSFSIIIFTDGSYKLAVGWPLPSALSFSSATPLKIWVTVPTNPVPIPLVGSAGFYIAKLNKEAAAAVFVDAGFGIVWMAGLGVTFGLGKEFDFGVGSIEAEAVAFFTVEGMLASKHGSLIQNGVDYYWVAGTLGISVSIEGKIDLKIISASIGATADLFLGIALETSHSTPLTLTFAFKFEFKVKIVFIKITVRVKFSITLLEFTFGSGPAAQLDKPTPSAGLIAAQAAALPAPLELAPYFADFEVTQAPAEKANIPLFFLPQPTTKADTSGGSTAWNPQLIASLAIPQADDGSGADEQSAFDAMVSGLASWLFATYGGGSGVSFCDQVVNVQKAVNTPGEFDEKVETALEAQFVFQINEVACDESATSPTSAMFPIFYQLKLNYNGHDIPLSNDQSVTTLSRHVVSDNYLAHVKEYFGRIAGPAQPNVSIAGDTTSPTFTQVAFNDYFVSVAKQFLNAFAQMCNGANPPTNLSQALQMYETDGGFADLAGAISRYYLGGMRLPDTSQHNQLEPFYDLTRQQIKMVESGDPAAWVNTVKLAYDKQDVSSWIQFEPPPGGGGTGAHEIHGTGGDDGNGNGTPSSVTSCLPTNEIAVDPPDPPTWLTDNLQELDPLAEFPQQYVLSNKFVLNNASKTAINTLYPLPQAMQSAVNENDGLILNLHEASTTPVQNVAAQAAPPALPGAAALFVKCSLRLVPDPNNPGQMLRDVYQLVGTDDETRAQLEDLLDHGSFASANLLVGTGNAQFVTTDASQIVLAKTNLSTLSQPAAAAAAFAVGDDEGPTHAILSNDPTNFLWLVWEASVVNAPGYFIHMDGSDLSFSNNQAPIAILLPKSTTPSANPRVNVYHNMVVMDADAQDNPIAAGIQTLGGKTILSYSPNYAPGRAGWQITAPAPSDGEATDLQDYVNSIYHNLQFRVTSLTGVTSDLPTKWSPPVNPTNTDDTTWFYRVADPIYKLIPDATNRYAAVGKTATFEFQVVDFYGNAMPPSSFGGALPTLQVKVVYNDALIAVSDWPLQQTLFKYESKLATQATLQIDSVFDTSTPNVNTATNAGEREMAARDLARYEIVLDQLTDPNVSVAVNATVGGNGLTKDDDGKTVLQKLTTYVEQIVDYLSAKTSTPPDGVTLNLSFDKSFVSGLPNDLVELDVAIATARKASSVDHEIAKLLPEVESITGTVVPNIPTVPDSNGSGGSGDSNPPQQTNVLIFAQDFEQAFNNFDGKGGTFKMAQGPQPGDSTATVSNRSFWAIRFGADSGINVTFPNATDNPPPADQPIYFSTAPLSTKLITRDAQVMDFVQQKVVTKTFSNVDLDLWARGFLLAFDELLSPELATAIAFGDFENDPYSQLMAAKAQLASSIPLGMQQVFTDQVGTGDTKAARDRLQQALLTELSNDYKMQALVQTPVQVTTQGTENEGEQAPPSLFGQASTSQAPSNSNGTNGTSNQNYTLTSSHLKLSGQDYLNFLLSAKHPAQQAQIDLSLFYDVGFFEHDFQPENAQFGYVPSSWLTFLLPADVALTPELGPVSIPIPLRVYPNLPTLVSQSATQDWNPVDPIFNGTNQINADVLKWTYALAVQKPTAAQDDLVIKVHLNRPVGPMVKRTVATPRFDAEGNTVPPADLFEALARFVSEYPAIKTQLDTIVKCAFSVDASDCETAQYTLTAILDLVNGVATTWKPWVELRDLLPAAAIAEQTWQYRAVWDENSKTLTLSWQGDGTVPEWNSVTIEDYELRTVDGDAAIYDLHGVSEFPGTLNISWHGLFVMNYQSALSSVQIERNSDLGDDVNPAFVYRTSFVSFTNPVVPQIDIPNKHVMNQEDSLLDALTGLFGSFDNGKGDVVDLRFDASYEFTVATTGSNGDRQNVDSKGPILLTQAEVKYSSNPIPTPPPIGIGEFDKAVAGSLSQWHENLAANIPNESLLFELTVFASVSQAQLPVVRLLQLLLPVPDDENWWIVDGGGSANRC